MMVKRKRREKFDDASEDSGQDEVGRGREETSFFTHHHAFLDDAT